MSTASTISAVLRTPVLDLVRGRVGPRSWRDIIAAAHLPAPAAGVVVDVVRRTRLRRGEKVDVARELIAHFADALEAGKTPEEVAEAFGDPPTAARLIGRAKKRARGLGWQVQKGIGWLILIALGIYLLLVARLFVIPTGPTTDLVAGLRSELPGNADDAYAWPLYLEALASLEGVDWSPEARGDLYDRFRGSKDSGNGTASLISQQPEVVEKLRAASRLPRILPLPSSDLDEEQLRAEMPAEMPDPIYPLFPSPIAFVARPTVDYANIIGYVLSSDLHLAAAEGDLDRVIEDTRALLRFADQWAKEPSDGHRWQATQARRHALVGLGEVLASQRSGFSDEQLVQSAHIVAAIDADDPHPGLMLGLRDFIQTSYSAGTLGEGHLTDEGVANLIEVLRGSSMSGAFYQVRHGNSLAYTALPVVAARFPNRQELEADADRLERLALEALAKPVHAALDTAYDAETAGWWKDGVPATPLDLLYSRLLPSSIDVARFGRDRIESMRDGLLVAIAAEVFRRDHDRWPQDIAELTPRYLPEPPVDAMTGQPIRMKLTDSLPLVYSVGLDGDDDGGRPVMTKRGKVLEGIGEWWQGDGDTRLWPPADRRE